MTQRDDVVRLEREFADAMQRMYVVGNGLARMRAELDHDAATSPPGAAEPQPATGAHTGGTVTRGVPVAPLPGPARASSPLPTPVPWYRREGAVTRVLAVSGAVVTLAGIAMLLVIAVRHGWFGPAARVSAGAALAAVLGVLGARGGARDRGLGRPVGTAAVALVATGAAAAFLDVVAVTVAYGWIPPVVGLVLCLGVAVAGLGLARAWSSETLAVLMVAGAGTFGPVVAGGTGWVLSALLTVLLVVGWWAADGRAVPVLTVVRTVPAVLSLLAAAATTPPPVEALGLAAVAAVVLVASLAMAGDAARRSVGGVAPTVSVGLAVVATLGVDAAQEAPLDTLTHLVVAAALLLTATTWGRPPFGPLPTHLVATTAGGGAVAAVLAAVTGAPSAFVGTGLLVLALGHLAVAGTARSRIGLALGTGMSAPAVLGWLDHAAAVTDWSSSARHDLPVTFLDGVLTVVLCMVGVWAATVVRGVPRPLRTAARVTGLAVGLGAVTTLFVSLGTMTGLGLAHAETGFTVGHAFATLAWMAVAAGLLLWSLDHASGADVALRTGLVVAAVAVAKLFLFDLAALDGVVRSLAFIGTGLLLLTTGSRYARAWEDVRRTPPAAQSSESAA
ncbi:DUF2339 domain-containing protein [Phycicoccus sp. CSK15P-2]|uniref:DUF2339 domain-containing protein n=1 Tax=Phycicoccus sp. CSK15P-2 TaxID=2807627 RepID=UPI00194E0C92|nr:DUF2339 domain-containing protein [Phycicoccus sp. CSK15P-2]MBM6403243.1 DUF2339 domain-containing protein [Phycicoccus sp. CSK15P-2]